MLGFACCMKSWALDSDVLLVLSGTLTNLSAGWLAAIPIVSIFSKSLTPIEFFKLLTINGSAGIVGIVLAVWLLKKGKGV